MADNKTPLRIDLVKNSNQKSDYFGHYYGRVVRVATLSTRAFAQHIADPMWPTMAVSTSPSKGTVMLATIAGKANDNISL